MPRPNGYLLDTNLLVALVRNNDLGKYLDKTYNLTSGVFAFHISVIVLGETTALALKLGWNAAKQSLLNTILGLFTPLDIFDSNVIQSYAEIDAGSEAVGIKMGKNDIWIAATAKRNDLTLLTTDKDFDHLHSKHIELTWVDPASR
jgi:tRNA(fMet)-specific endonuclease VapC